MSSLGSGDSLETVYSRPQLVINVAIKDFLEDFSLDDFSKQDLKGILSETDYEYVTEYDNKKYQILRLFDLLGAKSDLKTEKFITLIQKYYEWIVKKIPSYGPSGIAPKSLSSFEDLHHELRRHACLKYPDLYVRRVEPFLQLRNALLKLKPRQHVILNSELGFGKKWLAIDVCSDYQVMTAMGFKIFWIDVSSSKSPEEDLHILGILYSMIKHSNRTSTSPVTFDSLNQCPNNDNFIYEENKLRDKLKATLRLEENANCLIVIANIQKTKQIRRFDLPCKMLLITRNKKIGDNLPQNDTIKINIDHGISMSEFNFFLEKYLECPRESFPKQEAREIYKSSKGNPLMLSIIATSLKEDLSKIKWTEWMHQLQKNKNNKHTYSSNYRKLFEVVEKSLEILQPEEQHFYNILTIFPNREFVPTNLLKIFWKGTSAVEETLLKLYKHSFLEQQKNENGVLCYGLPFVYRSYLNEFKFTEYLNIPELHKQVLTYYDVAKGVEQRENIDMFVEAKHDFYFFHCLGYHMQEAGCNDLFSQVYFDFGFLQQKIRAVGVLRTIADLKRYEKEIASNDPRKYKYLEKLQNFLLQLERALIECKDTNLLQYALMENVAEEPIYDMACEQVQKFPGRLWFAESGFFHQRRQVIQLVHAVNRVIFCDRDNCLVFFDNGDVAQVKISLDYMPPNIKRLQCVPLEMQIFGDNNYLLCLKRNGAMLIGNIDEWQMPQSGREMSEIKVYEPIVAFDLEENGKEAILHAAGNSGKLHVFSWDHRNKQFEKKHSLPLSTEITNIRCLCKVWEKYYLLVDDKHKVALFYTVDTSCAYNDIYLPNIVYKIAMKFQMDLMNILFVCEKKVTILSLKSTDNYNLDISEQILLPMQGDLKKITCAKLTKDEKYLVLGTESGLFVYDMKEREIILSSNRGEEITCVDINQLADRSYKYIISCGSKNKRVLNLFSLQCTGNDAVQWAHKIGNKNTAVPSVNLQGGNLFDVRYNDNSSTVLAVDSVNRIHLLESEKTISQVQSIKNDDAVAVTCVCACENIAYIGNENGDVFEASEEKPVFIKNLNNKPIKFLHLVNNTLVISTDEKFALLLLPYDPTMNNIYEGEVRYCFKFSDDIVIISQALKQSYIWFAKMTRKFGLKHEISCCDMKDNLLFAISEMNVPYLYSFGDSITKRQLQLQDMQNKITCLAVSQSGREFHLIAAGGALGTIQLFKYYPGQSELRLFHIFKSHEEQIYDMKFSPSSKLLVSSSEQLCFWSITYALNNVQDTTPERLFNSRYQSEPVTLEECDATAFYMDSNMNASSNQEPKWDEKRGSLKNPALLSCIKFDGNKAEKFCVDQNFTKFHTIDSEGVCYILTVKEAQDFDKRFSITYPNEIEWNRDAMEPFIKNYNEGRDI